MRGKDSETHTVELQAASLFAAGYEAVQRWAMFWWFDPQALLTIKAGEQEWSINQDSVRKWRQSRVSTAASNV